MSATHVPCLPTVVTLTAIPTHTHRIYILYTVHHCIYPPRHRPFLAPCPIANTPRSAGAILHIRFPHGVENPRFALLPCASRIRTPISPTHACAIRALLANGSPAACQRRASGLPATCQWGASGSGAQAGGRCTIYVHDVREGRWWKVNRLRSVCALGLLLRGAIPPVHSRMTAE